MEESQETFAARLGSALQWSRQFATKDEGAFAKGEMVMGEMMMGVMVMGVMIGEMEETEDEARYLSKQFQTIYLLILMVYLPLIGVLGRRFRTALNFRAVN